MLVSGVQQRDSILHTHVSILFQILFPFRILRNIEQHSLCHTGDPRWLCVLNIAVCTCQSPTPVLKGRRCSGRRIPALATATRSLHRMVVAFGPHLADPIPLVHEVDPAEVFDPCEHGEEAGIGVVELQTTAENDIVKPQDGDKGHGESILRPTHRLLPLHPENKGFILLFTAASPPLGESRRGGLEGFLGGTLL